MGNVSCSVGLHCPLYKEVPHTTKVHGMIYSFPVES